MGLSYFLKRKKLKVPRDQGRRIYTLQLESQEVKISLKTTIE